MYLVLMERESSSGENVYMAKIETIQSFEYQLRSNDWSVIDVVPVKGSLFEVHFGSGGGRSVHSSDREYVAAVLTSCASDAIKLASNLTAYFENDNNKDCIRDNEPFGLALYIESETDCKGFVEISYF